jgi:putative transposase
LTILIKDEPEAPCIRRQCELLELDHASYYRNRGPKDISTANKYKEIKQALLDVNFENPSYGTRRLSVTLIKDYDLEAGRKLVRHLMAELGIRSIFPGPKTTILDPNHEKYPYLIKDLDITRINQVWSTDITYLRINGGWAYLVAIIDWYSRKILSWKLSNSLDRSFCIEALNEALAANQPEIFNSDQGCQFTSNDFTGVLKTHGVNISMDGKGRALDNVIIERFWRSLKYEHIFLNEYSSMQELFDAIKRFIDHYNSKRYHQSLDYKTPNQVWQENHVS